MEERKQFLIKYNTVEQFEILERSFCINLLNSIRTLTRNDISTFKKGIEIENRFEHLLNRFQHDTGNKHSISFVQHHCIDFLANVMMRREAFQRFMEQVYFTSDTRNFKKAMKNEELSKEVKSKDDLCYYLEIIYNELIEYIIDTNEHYTIDTEESDF